MKLVVLITLAYDESLSTFAITNVHERRERVLNVGWEGVRFQRPANKRVKLGGKNEKEELDRVAEHLLDSLKPPNHHHPLQSLPLINYGQRPSAKSDIGEFFQFN